MFRGGVWCSCSESGRVSEPEFLGPWTLGRDPPLTGCYPRGVPVQKGTSVSVADVARIWQASETYRFYSKINYLPSGCHQWTGALDAGYGRFYLRGKSHLAHRVAWELEHGTIPRSLQVDHLCRNRGCVNPDHLELVTLKENVLRGIGITATNKAKTHCRNGHELHGYNAYVTKRGSRQCRTCAVSRTQVWRATRSEV